MNHIRKIINNLDIIIYYININQEFILDYNMLVIHFCNSDDINRLNKFIHCNDKYQHLASIILQKYVVKNCVFKNRDISNLDLLKNRDISNLDLLINRDNKPFIQLPDNCFFDYNVSHDKDMIVVTSSNKYKIGIDIMSKDKESELEKISDLFLNKDRSNIY